MPVAYLYMYVDNAVIFLFIFSIFAFSCAVQIKQYLRTKYFSWKLQPTIKTWLLPEWLIKINEVHGSQILIFSWFSHILYASSSSLVEMIYIDSHVIPEPEL